MSVKEKFFQLWFRSVVWETNAQAGLFCVASRTMHGLPRRSAPTATPSPALACHFRSHSFAPDRQKPVQDAPEKKYPRFLASIVGCTQSTLDDKRLSTPVPQQFSPIRCVSRARRRPRHHMTRAKLRTSARGCQKLPDFFLCDLVPHPRAGAPLPGVSGGEMMACKTAAAGRQGVMAGQQSGGGDRAARRRPRGGEASWRGSRVPAGRQRATPWQRATSWQCGGDRTAAAGRQRVMARRGKARPNAKRPAAVGPPGAHHAKGNRKNAPRATWPLQPAAASRPPRLGCSATRSASSHAPPAPTGPAPR